eukprot:6121382-Lingulodinium_polyedra.AAC.1
MLRQELHEWVDSADAELIEQLHLIIKNDWIKYIVNTMPGCGKTDVNRPVFSRPLRTLAC